MTHYSRPDELVFASGAKPGEVQGFPDIPRGWGVAYDQTAGIPPMEWFNALFKRGDEGLRYLLQRGIADWSATEDYPVDAHVQEGGKVWKAKVANLGKRPSVNPGEWVETALTREALKALIQEQLGKSRVRLATTGNLGLKGLEMIDGVVPFAGDRVLVKDQIIALQNGIYIAASDTWIRDADADAAINVTPGMFVSVEHGAVNANSVWQLATDETLALGTSGLVFECVARKADAAVGSFNRVTVGKRGEVLGGSQFIKFDPEQKFPVQVHRKNLLINGDFNIWQRGTSITSSAPYGIMYTADRWRVNPGTVGSVAVTRQVFKLDQIEVAGEPTYFAQVVTSGGSNLNFRQRIESVKTLAGKKVAVSFYAKANSDVRIDVYLSQFFGTGGSPSARVDLINPINLSATWQRFILIYDLPSISDKALGSNGDDCLELLFFRPVTNLTFSLAQVQVEEGQAATSFDRRSLAEELGLCQRYFEKSYDLSDAPGTLTRAGAALCQSQASGAVGSSFNIWFNVRKRVAPAITAYNPDISNMQIRNTSAFVDCSSTSLGNIGQTCFSLNFMLPSSGAVNQNLQVHWTADAEL
ncbi:hypothetical protein [Metapseudomonas otitidis]|uniref:hypothetical protein n=1 Tax=Metapseudomonas otitidis TaxID=319939 RepID=UPI0008F29245|nr:hypothetical protein [Pseudomonas otitidis]SFA64419.1 hypothetical protein SAMN05216263_11514 [Pseudomonas otitidis]